MRLRRGRDQWLAFGRLQLLDDGTQPAKQSLRLSSRADVDALDDLSVGRGQDVDVDRSGASELRGRFMIDATPLLLLFLGCVALVVSFVGGVDWNEVVVEQTDDSVVRERTAPEIGCAASAPADVHLSHVAEEEDRSAALPRQALGRTNP